MIVGVLALAAVGAGLMVLGRTQGSSSASPGTQSTPKATSPATKGSAGPRGTVAPPAATPSPSPATGQPSDALPAAITEALAANRVVVVSLFDPAAKIDGTAMSEADAGAQLAGATFVSVNVSGTDVDSLNAHYGVIQDPAVLVLRPPGDLVVRIDGFADRDTVAQAAANAAQ